MSPKKERRSKKIEIAKEKPKRRLIPFTAGKLPSVSKAMPEVASAIPLVSKEIPLVSKPIPLVSAAPNITLPKFWENKAGRKKWAMSRMPITRLRKVTRPTDVGLFKALGEAIVSPVMGPMKMVEGIASKVKAQAEEEREPKVALEQELLELKMRYEMGEISEEDYKIQETKLKRRIKDLEEKATEESPERSREKKDI
ncbi:MAG: gas vesicle protein GvpG [Thermodesulfovibrionales bacterium]|nr:gas vesicle protein GvpG [Thermodesulfovibrionales bacterium]